nr:delta-60 repeat domain-containing protein [uncultured Rhodoferax sp.]
MNFSNAIKIPQLILVVLSCSIGHANPNVCVGAATGTLDQSYQDSRIPLTFDWHPRKTIRGFAFAEFAWSPVRVFDDIPTSILMEPRKKSVIVSHLGFASRHTPIGDLDSIDDPWDRIRSFLGFTFSGSLGKLSSLHDTVDPMNSPVGGPDAGFDESQCDPKYGCRDDESFAPADPTTPCGAQMNGADSCPPDRRIMIGGRDWKVVRYRFPAWGFAGRLDYNYGDPYPLWVNYASVDIRALGFSPVAPERTRMVVQKKDGKAVLVGMAHGPGVDKGLLILRLNENGRGIESSFTNFTRTGGVTESIDDVTIDQGGRIVVVGTTNEDGSYFPFIIRFNNDGSLDKSFGLDGLVVLKNLRDHRPTSVAVQNDSKVIVSAHMGLIRLEKDGRFDASFGNAGIIETKPSFRLVKVAIDSYDRLVVAGNLKSGNPAVPDLGTLLLRFNGMDGSLDLSFGIDGIVYPNETPRPDWSHTVTTMALEPDSGRIIVSGRVQSPAGTPRPAPVDSYFVSAHCP